MVLDNKGLQFGKVKFLHKITACENGLACELRRIVSELLDTRQIFTNETTAKAIIPTAVPEFVAKYRLGCLAAFTNCP